MSQTAETLNAIIRERRSVKPAFFQAEISVPDEIITRALENATWAPNHGKTEPWFFIVFTGEGIQRLATFQSGLYKQESGDRFNEGKYKKLKEDYLKASHVVAICYKRNPASRIPEIEEVMAVACAVQNFSLTLQAYGYGGYWTTGGVTYYESAKPFFDLGDSERLLGFYLCGVPEQLPVAPERSPVSEKTRWERK